MIDIYVAQTEEDYEASANLFLKYAQELPIALDFQHFEKELQNLKNIYSNAEGGIVLCKENNKYIGCAGIRRFSFEAGELKRMWIDPLERGKGVGKKIIEAAINLALSKNYKEIVLDTLDHMLPAIKIYKDAGFVETDAYYFNPYKNALYFKKILR